MYIELIRSQKYGDFSLEVPSLPDLPKEVEAAFQKCLGHEEKIRKILIAPKQMVPDRKPDLIQSAFALAKSRLGPVWVLVMTQERLLIATVQNPNRPPEITSIQFSDLLTLELGEILLFSWIHFVWRDASAAAHFTVYFNTVKDEYYRAILSYILQEIGEKNGVVTPPILYNAEYFLQLPYKYSSIIPLYLLLPGEQIEAAIYQPPGYRIILRLFRKKHSVAKVLLLTNYQLLIIGEEFASGTSRYGWIAKFCPRQNIRNVTLEPGKTDVQLAITLENAGVTESVLLLLDKGFEPHLQELISSLPNAEG